MKEINGNCQKEIESVLNKYKTSKNTFDFVLAKYLENCLNSFNDAITLKEKIDNERLIDEIEDENDGAFIISEDSEKLVTVFEIPDEKVNIFDEDEDIIKETDSEEDDNDFWNS